MKFHRSLFFLSFFSTNPKGSVWWGLWLSPPPGHPNPPHLLFSIISRKFLHIMWDFVFSFMPHQASRSLLPPAFPSPYCPLPTVDFSSSSSLASAKTLGFSHLLSEMRPWELTFLSVSPLSLSEKCLHYRFGICTFIIFCVCSNCRFKNSFSSCSSFFLTVSFQLHSVSLPCWPNLLLFLDGKFCPLWSSSAALSSCCSSLSLGKLIL